MLYYVDLSHRVDEVPKFYDVVFSFLGTAGWLWVGYMWHDRALIVLNTILISMLSLSLFRYFVIRMGQVIMNDIKKDYFTTGQMRNALIQIEDLKNGPF